MKKLQLLPSDLFLKLLFCFFSLAFLVAAPLMPDRGEMLAGLWNIMRNTCKVATNTFDSGGFAGSFLNAGLVGIICTAVFFLPKAKPQGPSVIAFLLTVGFAFWGVNPLNMCFGFFGVALYCLVKKESLGSQANAMLFTTGLAPLISDLLLRYPNAEATGFSWSGLAIAFAVALVIGFFLPAGLSYSPNVHKGFDLYSAAMPLGMTAFFLRSLLYQVLGGTLPEGTDTVLTVASQSICNIFCTVLFVLCIVVAFLMGCRPRDYWDLMKDSGLNSDFAGSYGNATFLMNVGVYGLFILLYYNLIGASFNAVTFACVFCMLSCCNSDSHPRNVWPIMLGYVAASFLFQWLSLGEYTLTINAQPIVIGLCFASGLSPISGKYGWYYGTIAAMIHFVLVTSVPALHGAFCLYNGGFTAAFVCLLFVPIMERFCKTKAERKAIKKKIKN